MRVFRRIQLRTLILIFLFLINLFLLLANFAWAAMNKSFNSIPYWVAGYFQFGRFRDSDGTLCLAIIDRREGKPIVIERHLGIGLDRIPGEFNFYFRGTNILNIYNKPDRFPIYQFVFHGPRKSQVWWVNAGGGSLFTERAFYDAGGNLTNQQMWYDQAWRSVDRQNGTKGIVINRQWYKFRFDKNHMVTIETNVADR